MTRWFELADVVALNGAVMRGMGWSPAPLRDEGALESAVQRPRMAAHYENADLVRQAALLALGISQAQSFIDGNKRTAFATFKIFLELNGQPFTPDPVDAARELERVAEAADRRAGEEAFETWLRRAVDIQST